MRAGSLCPSRGTTDVHAILYGFQLECVYIFHARRLCLQAGAKHVYGIECSGIAEMATQIVADNGYSDKVTIIKAKVRARFIAVWRLMRHCTWQGACRLAHASSIGTVTLRGLLPMRLFTV